MMTLGIYYIHVLGDSLVRGGVHENVLVVGYEHMRHPDNKLVTKGLAGASHWDTEGSAGNNPNNPMIALITLIALIALIALNI